MQGRLRGLDPPFNGNRLNTNLLLTFFKTRDVEAEAGSGSGGSGPFSVEAEARKSYRFRFHIGYLNWRVTWRKSFVHFPMWIKR